MALPHETYMLRCLQLARLGEGFTAPNPMVGAVLVHEDRIIGEGWHRQFGGPHAEVNCLASVRDEDRALIPRATMYVSLEPCAHHGKTPPCADLLVREQVARVVVGCRDPFPAVDGKGIDRLRAAGIEVVEGVLADECGALNKVFFYAHTQHRAWVTLKWAETADGFIAGPHGKRAAISNAQSARQVHRLRATHQAILVGTNTALFDDPSLTTRHWPGRHPLRIVLDRQLRLPALLQLFNGEVPTLVLNALRNEQHHNLECVKTDLDDAARFAAGLPELLYRRGIQSVLVEGGAQLLQSFINAGAWNELVRITATGKQLGAGIAAPVFGGGTLAGRDWRDGDRLDRYRNPAAKG